MLPQGRDVRRQRPDRPAAGRRLEALDPDAAERRRRARLLALRQRRRRPHDVGVLVGVALPDVPVLEVDPQVLHRLGGQLGPHPRHQVVVAHQRGERVGVLVEHLKRRRAVRRHQVGGVPVRGHVHRVHRLPPRPLPRVPARQRRVRRRQPLVELGCQSGGELAGVGHAAHPTTRPLRPALHKARARRLGSRSGQTTHRGMVRPSRNGETSEEGASRRAWRDIGRRPGPHHGPTGSRNSPVRRGHTRRARTPQAVSHKKERVTTDELPNPEEDKRRALREEAVKAVLNGEATPVQRGASTVVKLGGANAKGAAAKRMRSTSSSLARPPTASS